MTWTWGVSLGYTMRQLEGRKRVRRDGYTEAVARATLLADLVFADKLRDTETDIVIDSGLTGFVPADKLLRSIAANHGWALDAWVGLGPSVQTLLLDELVRLGIVTMEWRLGRRVWVLRRTYELQRGFDHDANDDAIAATIDLFESISRGGVADADAVKACGRSAWLVSAVSEFMHDARIRAAVSQAAAQGGGV